MLEMWKNLLFIMEVATADDLLMFSRQLIASMYLLLGITGPPTGRCVCGGGGGGGRGEIGVCKQSFWEWWCLINTIVFVGLATAI